MPMPARLRLIAMPVLRLRNHLALLLVLGTLASLALVLAGTLAIRVPRVEADTRQSLMDDIAEMRTRMELLLEARHSRLVLLKALTDEVTPDEVDELLDRAVGDGHLFRVVYRVSPKGRVVGAGLTLPLRAAREDLLDNDVAAYPLLVDLSPGPGPAWSGNQLSVLNGERVAAVAVRDAFGDALVAEMPLGTLFRTVHMASNVGPSSVWVIDRTGEIVAESDAARNVRRLNVRRWPLLQSLLRSGETTGRLDYQGVDYHVAVARSPALGWILVGRTPAGWDNPQVREVLSSAVLSFAGSLGFGLLFAMAWAQRMARPLDHIIERVERSAAGDDAGLPWPHGAVTEFNRLSRDLEALAADVHERERKAQAIFHAVPVPMTVTREDGTVLDVNDAWCTELCRRREDALGRAAQELDPAITLTSLLDPDERADGGVAMAEVELRRDEGTCLLMQISVREVVLPSGKLLIWSGVDIGPMRTAEDDLRALNLQLEERVHQRTEALAQANATLSSTVEELGAAKGELVRAGKLAALGRLVAGVARELNSPLGNGLIAVDAMDQALHDYQASPDTALKRSALDQLVATMAQGADIAGRNLRRAADLVHSFKQVAVDRTSDQRRSFALREVVEETVVSLRPSLAPKAWQVEIDIPDGLRLDSYPGALGQALGNLVQNAVLHGFDGRDDGTVRITGGCSDAPGEDGWIWLRVADDGHGIAADLIDHIFEAFTTAGDGRGGIGLGLHIGANAVTLVLGGTLAAHSVPGAGATFEMRLPPIAPRAAVGGR